MERARVEDPISRRVARSLDWENLSRLLTPYARRNDFEGYVKLVEQLLKVTLSDEQRQGAKEAFTARRKELFG